MPTSVVGDDGDQMVLTVIVVGRAGTGVVAIDVRHGELGMGVSNLVRMYFLARTGLGKIDDNRQGTSDDRTLRLPRSYPRCSH